ncbi:hypothetical protein [Ornithinibacillus scapharcae]|uniref:hypothetical protein n=1 Tax=Ornithinibacillus scapharcae TaxID=1147159 RepID=UPI000225BBA6|nr:hypothetical protein [Ornithinibacillus scapharcae]
MENVKVEKDDQAKELRAILNELNNHSEQEHSVPTNDDISVAEAEDSNLDQERVETSEMNVLNLPPRSVVHGYENKKVHFKISKPLLRLLMVIMLVVLILGVYIFLIM